MALLLMNFKSYVYERRGLGGDMLGRGFDSRHLHITFHIKAFDDWISLKYYQGTELDFLNHFSAFFNI